jgi:hypothetical protein
MDAAVLFPTGAAATTSVSRVEVDLLAVAVVLLVALVLVKIKRTTRRSGRPPPSATTTPTPPATATDRWPSRSMSRPIRLLSPWHPASWLPVERQEVDAGSRRRRRPAPCRPPSPSCTARRPDRCPPSTRSRPSAPGRPPPAVRRPRRPRHRPPLRPCRHRLHHHLHRHRHPRLRLRHRHPRLPRRHRHRHRPPPRCRRWSSHHRLLHLRPIEPTPGRRALPGVITRWRWGLDSVPLPVGWFGASGLRRWSRR